MFEEKKYLLKDNVEYFHHMHSYGYQNFIIKEKKKVFFSFNCEIKSHYVLP